jgi:penicillin amidase
VKKLSSPSGTFKVVGVSSDVEVITDVHGVPHIYGETVEDTFFGLGYVHGAER